ncbi:MAG TPA: WXG100 family type VII secretion target [Anaerolineales bacterium]
MAPQARANPEDLRKFAAHLKQFNNAVRDNLAILQAEFRDLGTSWQDQEYIRFAQEFDQTTRVLTQFIRFSDEQIPFILRKAERIDDYLNQR